MCYSFIMILDLALKPLYALYTVYLYAEYVQVNDWEESRGRMFDFSSNWHSCHLCNSSILVPDKNGASLMPFELFFFSEVMAMFLS